MRASITSSFDYLSTLLYVHRWLVYLCSTVGVAIVLTYACYFIHQKIRIRLVQRAYFVTHALLEAIYLPLILFIWVKAITSIVDLFTEKMEDIWGHLAEKIHDASLSVLLAWIVIRFIGLFEEQLLLGHLTKKYPDETTVRAISKLLRVCATIIVALFLLPFLGINISGIVAFGGGSAIVLGIGAKQIFASYFGGLVIYADRHFKVGDWIASPEKSVEGQVEYIGWRSTQIRTSDQKVCYVPNDVLSSVIVINASRTGGRCIRETINVRHADVAVLTTIIQEVRTVLRAHAGIDQRRPLLVHFTGFGPYSLKISVHVPTKAIDRKAYCDIKQDILLSIVQIIERNGAALAYPFLVEKMEV